MQFSSKDEDVNDVDKEEEVEEERFFVFCRIIIAVNFWYSFDAVCRE